MQGVKNESATFNALEKCHCMYSAEVSGLSNELCQVQEIRQVSFHIQSRCAKGRECGHIQYVMEVLLHEWSRCCHVQYIREVSFQHAT